MEEDARRLIVRLAVAVMTADGRITTSEETALRRLDKLGLGPLSSVAAEEITRAKKEAVDISATCEQLTGMSPEAAAVLITLLSEIAVSDRSLSATERVALHATAKLMGLGTEQTKHIIDSVAAAYEAELPPENDGAGMSPLSPRIDREASWLDDPGLRRAYRVLGLEPGASRVNIDAAYLGLIDRYNPAKVIELGPDFAVLAVRKLAEATTAFETVRVSLGVTPRA